MKTKITIFITAIALLFGVTSIAAQGTKAYFKKDGVTVFESKISEIDSIVFAQEPNLVIPLNSSDPLLCSYTQGNKSISLYGIRDETGMPKQLEVVFIKNEIGEIIMQIYFDEYERPIRFITEDNLLICDYITDKKALITLTTKEGEIYSGEMDVDIQKAKTISSSLRNGNSTDRKCIIQVTNCGQPYDRADVFVVATRPYSNDKDVFSRPFPAKSIGGGLYECIIPYRTGYYINPQGVCEWTKEKIILLTKIICTFSNPAICPVFIELGPGGILACVSITEILQILCIRSDDIIKVEESIGKRACSYMSNKDWYLTEMKLTPFLQTMPGIITGESVVIAGDDAIIPNLSIKTSFDCDLTTPKLIISNIQAKSATATVSCLMGIIEEIGVCYSSSNSTPTKENGGTIVKQKTYGIGSTSLNTSLSLTNLTEDTKYYIKPFVKIMLMNEEYYKYGDVQTFTTLKKEYNTCEDFDNPQGFVEINGVRWATRNVGASSPCDCGGYYTFEEAQAIGAPTHAEIQKLLNTNNVTSQWLSLNGVKGRKFTDKTTGNSIFLPAAGFRSNAGTLYFVGDYGYYWSSTAYDSYYDAYFLNFFSTGAITGGSDNIFPRTLGFSVRTVVD